ncbi:MAG: glutamate--tRNA ligase [Nanoarchaeota archaeon]
MKELVRELVLKHTLHNALQFAGKANPKVVLGLVLKEDPSLKQDVPGLLKEIEATVTEIGQFSPSQIKQKLQALAPELLEELEGKKEAASTPLKPLPNAKTGKFIVRIAPSPSGALHVGHAYGAALNYEYAKMYHGKLLLRIEDTNPENIYPPAYQLIEEDANWLTDKGISQVVVQSSRLGIYYDHAEKLVQQGKAYVCTCDADHWRELKKKSVACPCRTLTVSEQQLRYAKMFNGYAEGEAVLRLKTDIQHRNPAMRDFAIMRIVEHIHPKTGKEQRVWPLMVFSVAIDDHDLGITHVLNGKDHLDNAAKERLIMDCFNWPYPEYAHWGRINFEDLPLSSTETRQAIEEGMFTGWDDIKIPFLPALRKRGYQAGAFRKFALEIGLSQNDKTVSREEFWKMINAFNKDIVDPLANRYFFIDDPVEVIIHGFPGKEVGKEVKLELHPDQPERGFRTFKAGKEFHLSLSDYKRLADGYLHRLMDLCNFELRGEEFHYVPGTYEDYKNAKKRGHIIHWLPAEEKLKVEVRMDDGRISAGFGESAMRTLAVGTIIQAERRYFARVVDVGKDKIELWYLHK